MRIPLPRMMRQWRAHEFAAKRRTASRTILRLWAWGARRPRLYHFAANLKMRALAALGRRRGRFRYLPLAGAWTRHRDLPAPQGKTFQRLWAERRR